MQAELDYVLEQLRLRKHTLKKMAAATGLNKGTIWCIQTGKTTDPGVKTVLALLRFFKSHEM